MFNATELMKEWNRKSHKGKKLENYFGNKTTKKFIIVLQNEENLNTPNSVYLKNRSKYGGTWMSPLLFIDFFMWLDSKFKVKVVQFVYDQLIDFAMQLVIITMF